MHVNEPRGGPETAAHLLTFDSVHGRWERGARGGGATLTIDGVELAFSEATAPGEVDWAAAAVEVVLECSGRFRTMQALAAYFERGVQKVIVAAPVKDPAALNVVVGVNDDHYDPTEYEVVTAASCTTNCLAPVVQVLHEGLGVLRGSITTLHDLTNTQTIVDAPHKDLRRARASGVLADPDIDGVGDRDRPDLPRAERQARRARGPRPPA